MAPRAAKSTPATPETRFRQLEADVQKLVGTLAELSQDSDMLDLIHETHSSEFSSYNLSIILGAMVSYGRTVYDELARRAGGEPRVVTELPRDHPNRVRPLREVWPLCEHDKMIRVGPIPTPSEEAPQALSEHANG